MADEAWGPEQEVQTEWAVRLYNEGLRWMTAAVVTWFTENLVFNGHRCWKP